MHHPTDRIAHTTAFATPVVEHWLEREIDCLYNMRAVFSVSLSGNSLTLFFILLFKHLIMQNIIGLTNYLIFITSKCGKKRSKIMHYISETASLKQPDKEGRKCFI